MRRTLFLFLCCFTLTICLACGGGDSAPGFPVGTWELSEITFRSDAASVSTSGSGLNTFKFTFAADNTLTATGTQSEQSYTWSYDEATGEIVITGAQNFTITATMAEDEFSYQAYNILNMSNTAGEERQIAEFAASSFIQANINYNSIGGLEVYFKFKKI